MQEFTVQTSERYELVDITEEVEKIVSDSGVKEGICLVFVPHSTAGVLLSENERGLKRDFHNFFEKLVEGFDFEHNRIDDNADSHLLSAIVGQGKSIIVKDGKLVRGTWQQIFLAEFDGPRTRRVLVKTTK